MLWRIWHVHGARGTLHIARGYTIVRGKLYVVSRCCTLCRRSRSAATHTGRTAAHTTHAAYAAVLMAACIRKMGIAAFGSDRTGLTPVTSVCTGTGLTPATSAPGLGSPLQHRSAPDWARPLSDAIHPCSRAHRVSRTGFCRSDWVCFKCSEVNKKHNEFCYKCKSLKRLSDCPQNANGNAAIPPALTTAGSCLYAPTWHGVRGPPCF